VRTGQSADLCDTFLAVIFSKVILLKVLLSFGFGVLILALL